MAVPGQIVREERWTGEGATFRATVVRRPDGLFEPHIERYYPGEVTEYGETPGGWTELPSLKSLADTIERAWGLVEEERLRLVCR